MDVKRLSIPSYASGVTRVAGRVVGLTLRARAEAPTSRPSKENTRSVSVHLERRDNGSIVIKAERGSRLVFEPGVIQLAIADLEDKS